MFYTEQWKSADKVRVETSRTNFHTACCAYPFHPVPHKYEVPTIWWGFRYYCKLIIVLRYLLFYSILLKQQFYYYYYFYLAFITEIWKEPCRFSVSVSSYPEFLSRAASPYPSPTCSQLAHYQKIVPFIPFSFSHKQSLLLWITNVRKTNKQT